MAGVWSAGTAMGMTPSKAKAKTDVLALGAVAALAQRARDSTTSCRGGRRDRRGSGSEAAGALGACSLPGEGSVLAPSAQRRV